MDLSLLITLIVGLFGGGGIVTLIQFFVKRKDDKKDELHKIQKDIGRLCQRADEGDLNDSRIQLMMLMWHNPADHRAILKEAEHYFLDLGGNSWIAHKFEDWAESEGVKIDYIIEEHNKREEKKGKKK